VLRGIPGTRKAGLAFLSPDVSWVDHSSTKLKPSEFQLKNEIECKFFKNFKKSKFCLKWIEILPLIAFSYLKNSFAFENFELNKIFKSLDRMMMRIRYNNK